MILKVVTSSSDYSEVYGIGYNKIASIDTGGSLTKLNMVFDSGYSNQNQVITLTIDSGKANEVIECINVAISKAFNAQQFAVTLIDKYSNYKICPFITDVEVKIRKV
jgi:hypothetical protein